MYLTTTLYDFDCGILGTHDVQIEWSVLTYRGDDGDHSEESLENVFIDDTDIYTLLDSDAKVELLRLAKSEYVR